MATLRSVRLSLLRCFHWHLPLSAVSLKQQTFHYQTVCYLTRSKLVLVNQSQCIPLHNLLLQTKKLNYRLIKAVNNHGEVTIDNEFKILLDFNLIFVNTAWALLHLLIQENFYILQKLRLTAVFSNIE